MGLMCAQSPTSTSNEARRRMAGLAADRPSAAGAVAQLSRLQRRSARSVVLPADPIGRPAWTLHDRLRDRPVPPADRDAVVDSPDIGQVFHEGLHLDDELSCRKAHYLTRHCRRAEIALAEARQVGGLGSQGGTTVQQLRGAAALVWSQELPGGFTGLVRSPALRMQRHHIDAAPQKLLQIDLQPSLIEQRRSLLELDEEVDVRSRSIVATCHRAEDVHHPGAATARHGITNLLAPLPQQRETGGWCHGHAPIVTRACQALPIIVTCAVMNARTTPFIV